jgi:hypothetical protein
MSSCGPRRRQRWGPQIAWLAVCRGWGLQSGRVDPSCCLPGKACSRRKTDGQFLHSKLHSRHPPGGQPNPNPNQTPTRRSATLCSCAWRATTTAAYSTASLKTSWRRRGTPPAAGRVGGTLAPRARPRPTPQQTTPPERCLARKAPAPPPADPSPLITQLKTAAVPPPRPNRQAGSLFTAPPSGTSSTAASASATVGCWLAPTRTSPTPTAASSSSRWTSEGWGQGGG